MSDETRQHRHAPWYVWIVGGCLVSVAVIIVGCALLFGVFGGLLLRLGSMQEAQTTTSRTLIVSGTPQLAVDNFAGSVRIEPGASGQVTVQATKHARDNTPDAAQRDLDGVVLSIQSSGDTVTVRAGITGNADLGPARSVDLHITTPPQTNIQVRQGAGDVALHSITGTLSASVDAGNLDLVGVTLMGQSNAQVRSGSVALGGNLGNGATLSVQVDAGDVSARLPSTAAIHVDAMASSGRVSVSGWQFSARHTLTLSQVAGDTAPHPTGTLVIRVGTGNVTIAAGQ